MIFLKGTFYLLEELRISFYTSRRTNFALTLPARNHDASALFLERPREYFQNEAQTGPLREAISGDECYKSPVFHTKLRSSTHLLPCCTVPCSMRPGSYKRRTVGAGRHHGAAVFKAAVSALLLVTVPPIRAQSVTTTGTSTATSTINGKIDCDPESGYLVIDVR